MAYIWINPVVDRMYDTDTLDELLQKHGYQRLYTSTDWLTIVKEKYRAAVEQSENVVMDMRCPKTKEVLDELHIDSKVTFPKIHPILIHSGEEVGLREDVWMEDKVITTPCQSLADQGNAMGLERTTFVPWRTFLESIGEYPKGNLPKNSPIPAGFFSDLQIRTDSVTGEDEIREYFKNFPSTEEQKAVQLVEMLYCKDGCHNGDGIRS